MSILKQKLFFFNHTLGLMPKKLYPLYTFGFWALVGERIVSVRGNARQLMTNEHTAKTKAWRLLKNQHLASALPLLLANLNLVKQTSTICLDFSDFHGWQVLTFAMQTHKGRAIPVYLEVTSYPIPEHSQNLFIIQEIEHFVGLVGFRPLLVMDRGFACPFIIKHLVAYAHPFIVRIKSGKQLTQPERMLLIKANHTRKQDQWVDIYEASLRLVTSKKRLPARERWYLVTNVTDQRKEAILCAYYHRFEIEEFFKDAKWLLGLKHVRFFKKQSIAIVLWFTLLGLWLSWLYASCLPWLSKNHHQVSFPRMYYEQWQQELRTLAFKALGITLTFSL